MKERRKQCEDAHGEERLRRGGGVHCVMSQPVQSLCHKRNAHRDDEVAEQPRTQGERPLLHAGVQTGGQRDVGNLDGNYGKPAVRT